MKKQGLDEDGMDLDAPIDGPNKLAWSLPKSSFSAATHPRSEVVMWMLDGERRQILGRNGDSTVMATPHIERRQKRFRIGDDVSGTAALIAFVAVVRHVVQRAVR